MGHIWEVKKNKKTFTLVHIETVQVSSPRIIQTKGFEMPFVWFIGVVASRIVSPFEANAHLIDVNILIAFEVALIQVGEMIQKGCHSPKRIGFLKDLDLFVSVIM